LPDIIVSWDGLQHNKEKLSLLEALPMFELLSEHQKDTLVEALEHRELKEGDVLLERGSPTGETVAVIKTGEIALRR
jgi:signal-transduction protein with cAMP-binding, CBS, and nucleotidyltransferase domain